MATGNARRNRDLLRTTVSDWVFCGRNRDLLRTAVSNWQGVRDNSLEATYLQWLDVSELGFTNPHAAFEARGRGLKRRAALWRRRLPAGKHCDPA